MSEITFPSSFEELVNNNGFNITSTELVMNMENDEITQYIQELIQSGSDMNNEEAVDKAISFLYSSFDSFSNFSVENQSMFVQYLIDQSKICVDLLATSTSNSEKSACKKILYLFQHFCIKMEVINKNIGGVGASSTTASKAKGSKKKADSENFCWADLRVYAVEVLDLLVGPSLSSSWPMGLVQENFLSGIWNYTLRLLVDRPVGVGGTAHKEVAVRALCGKVFAKTVGHFGNAQSSSSYAMLSTALLEAIVQHEHFALAQGAELCAQCKSTAPSQGSQVVTEILNEVCRMNYANMPASSTKNVSSFMEAFAKLAPACVSDAFPVLVKHLDSPAHQIRSAIIQACGYIVSYIHDTVAVDTSAGTVSGSEEGSEADSTKNTASMVRSRDVILDILVERTHDVNPYTRAAVLKVWSRLLENNSVPVKRVGIVAQIAVDRLHDKNASVRRNAVVLMTTAIENNPFSGTLDAALFRLQQSELLKTLAARLEELRVAFKEVSGITSPTGSNRASKSSSNTELKVISEEDEEEEGGDEEDKESEEKTTEEETEEEQLARAAEEEEFLQSPEVVEDTILAETRAKLEYVGSVMGMITSIETAVPKIAGMLQSKTTGDVVEALRFFVRAINFKVSGALTLFKSAFSLVWHQDPAIKSEMLSAFSAVYLTDGAGEQAEALAPEEIAHNLMHLVRHCDASEMTSMEKIVGEMFSTHQVNEDVIDRIWEKIEKLTSGVKKIVSETGAATQMPVAVGFTDLGACLRIISMISLSVPSLMSEEKVALIVNSGFSSDVLQRGDFSALKAAVQCLQSTKPFLKHCDTATSRDAYMRSKMHAILLEAAPMLATVLMGNFCGDNEIATREWFSLCEEAMHALFHLHPCPDRVVTLVLQQMYAGLYNAVDAVENSGRSGVCGVSRLLFVLGQTSLCSLVYTEFIAATAKKYPVKDADEAARQPVSKVSKKAAKSDNETSTNGFKEEVGAVDAMEEEMGAAAAADADHERVLNQIIDQELVLKNLLGKFLPLLSYMVANEQKQYSHTLLRETSILAMCRYMCTSSIVCESLLPLLFTVLERESSVPVRTSIIIALGDLAFRFPNSIEPWTHRMYSRLRDENVTVRYNTLMVITHLVLNDMIKVKGQVAHVAHSLNDPNESIAELAKLFFIKLSERSNNPVYNLLGDIISIFSQDQNEMQKIPVEEEVLTSAVTASAAAGQDLPALSKEQFQSTMHFLLSFVQKDKQADTLLERLLLRMSMSPSVTQRRNLAFCISELSVTEKGVKKMIELIKNIKDSLYDNEVYECFRTTLARAKKAVRVGATSETKGAVEEFEALMERIHSAANGEDVDADGVALDMGDVRVALEALDANIEDDGEVDTTATGTVAVKSKAIKGKAPSKKAATKAKAVPKRRAARRGESSDEEDADNSAEDEENDLDDNSSDVENRATQNTKKSAASGASKAKGKAPLTKSVSASRSRRAVVQDDDDDED